MPKQTLTSLKFRTAEAQKEQETILKVVEIKRHILDELQNKIRTAEKTLEDNYSHKDLDLQKEHLESKKKLDSDINNIKNTLTVIKEREQEYQNIVMDLEGNISTLRLTVSNQDQSIRNNNSTLENLKIETIELRGTKTKINNEIDELKAQRKTLEDELSAQIMTNGTTLFDLQTRFNEEKDTLELQIKESKDELRSLQQAIQLHSNKMAATVEEYKKKDNDLIQRENALIIRSKTLQKQQQEFEIEQRRWNYIKPLE